MIAAAIPRLWMAMAWGSILSVIFGVCAGFVGGLMFDGGDKSNNNGIRSFIGFVLGFVLMSAAIAVIAALCHHGAWVDYRQSIGGGS